MKNLTYFLLASLFLLASCSGLLDHSPEDALALDEAFERPQDLERGLIAAYSLLSSEPLCGRNQLLFADLMGGRQLFPHRTFPRGILEFRAPGISTAGAPPGAGIRGPLPV